MEILNFTLQSLNALKQKDKRYDITDKKIRELKILVAPTGVKTFYLYKKIQGKPERIKIARLGDLPLEKVRNEATRLLGEIAQGKNPQDIKRDRLFSPKISWYGLRVN